MHVCFAWIDYFNPVSWQNNLLLFSSLYSVYQYCEVTLLTHIYAVFSTEVVLLLHIYAVFSTEVVLLLHIYAVFSTEVVLLNHIYTGILRYCGSVIFISTQVFFDTVVVLQVVSTQVFSDTVVVLQVVSTQILW